MNSWPWGPDDPFRDIILEQAKLEEALALASNKETPIYDGGTYAPTYLGATLAGVTTYTLQAGFWRRIGTIMVTWGAVVWSAATGTGTALISLPFPSSSVANSNFSGSVRCSSVTFANSTPQVQFAASATAWQMLSPLTNAGGTLVAVEAAGNLIWTIVYIVDP